MSLAAEISFQIKADTDAPGNDYKRLRRVSLKTCEARCLEDEKCAAFTYNERRRMCFLKDQTDPRLEDYSGATTGLKQVIQQTDQSPGEPAPEVPSPAAEDDLTSPTPSLPGTTDTPLEPEIQAAPTGSGCTLFDSDFALIRNPNIVLKFDRVQDDAAGPDKVQMSFLNQGAKVLSGRLRLEADQFRFIEDSEAAVSRGVTILDRNNPSGNSISDPVFVVVDRLPFDGGVFRRVGCPTP